jgi:hypothetical protein
VSFNLLFRFRSSPDTMLHAVLLLTKNLLSPSFHLTMQMGLELVLHIYCTWVKMERPPPLNSLPVHSIFLKVPLLSAYIIIIIFSLANYFFLPPFTDQSKLPCGSESFARLSMSLPPHVLESTLKNIRTMSCGAAKTAPSSSRCWVPYRVATLSSPLLLASTPAGL